MDDAMGDRVDRRQFSERVVRERVARDPLERALGDRGVAVVEHAQLQAARARVDHEQAHDA
jgi:hypothetical protein